MFRFLCIFGPAAITYLIYIGLTGKKVTNYFVALMEVILFAMLNTGILFAALSPFGRVELIKLDNGVREIRYGGTAFLLSFVVSAVLGVVSAMITKRVEIRLDITEKKKGTSDETSKLD